MSDWDFYGFLWAVAAPLSGAFAAILTTKRLATSDWSRSFGGTARAPVIAAFVAGAIASPFIWFFGIVVGGTPGGGLGSFIGSELGISESAMIPIGVSLGIFIVVWLGLSAVCCLSFFVTRSAERAVRNQATTAKQ